MNKEKTRELEAKKQALTQRIEKIGTIEEFDAYITDEMKDDIDIKLDGQADFDDRNSDEMKANASWHRSIRYKKS